MTDQAQQPIAIPPAEPVTAPVDPVIVPPVTDAAVADDSTLIPTPVATPVVVEEPVGDEKPSESALEKPLVTTSEKTPLELLDQILNDAEAKTAEVTAAKEAEEKERIEAEITAKKAADQQKIGEELAALKQVQFSPQERAKDEQELAADQKEAAYKAEMAGMEIVQLGHTKV